MENLDELIGGPSISSSPAGVPRINYTHDALIDLLILHPDWTQNEIAAAVGYSASWVSTIMSSDAFKAKYAARRAQFIDPQVARAVEQGILGNFDETILRSQAILLDRLRSGSVPDNLALRALEVSSRARGYGAREPTPMADPNTQSHLEKLAENMTALLAKKRQVQTIDGEIIHAKQDDTQAA